MTRRPSRKIIGLAGLAALVCVFAQGVLASPFNQAPDPSWQTNGRVRAIVYTGATAYIGGEFTEVRPAGGGAPVTRNHLAALDATTGRLLPWNPDANGNVWTLALDAAHATVYVGGQFTTVGAQTRSNAGAVDAAGGAVLPWDPEPNGIVYTLEVAPAGNVLLGGSFSVVSAHTRNRLAEVAADGTLLAWAPSVKQKSGYGCPPTCPPVVASVALSADGSVVYFGGHFGLVNGVPRNNAAAVDTATGATLPWNPDVIGTGPGQNPNQVNRVWHVEVAADRAYLCGDYWSLDGLQVHPNLAAVDLVDGHLIKSFKATTDGDTPTCLVQDGVLYIGGHYLRVGPKSAWVFIQGHKATLTGPGSRPRVHIAAVDATAGAIDGWDPTANSTLGVHALALRDTQLAVGGDFTTIGGVDQQGFALFSLDTTPPDTAIDSGPPPTSSKKSATFSFHSTEKGSSHRCSLDGAVFVTCSSPFTYSGLGSGEHGFLVGAVDPAGNVDPSPAAYSWTIEGTTPAPATELSASVVSRSRVVLSWAASPDPGVAVYRIYRDGSVLGQTTQTSYADTAVMGPMTFNYTVRAVDQAGSASVDSNVARAATLPTSLPVFTDDFESGDLSQWTSVSGLLVQDRLVFEGTFAARATSTGEPTYAERQLLSASTELFYDARVKILSQSTQATLLRLETALGVPVLRVFTNKSGQLSYQNERKLTVVTSATASLGPGWHDLQVRVLVNGTAGEVELWLDGIRVTDLARSETLGLTLLGRIRLGDGATGHTYDVALDQVAAGLSFVAG